MLEQLRDVQKFADAMELDTSLVVRGLAFRAFNGLSLRTPVDTGRARANWQISIGEPATGEVGSPSKGAGAHKEKSKPPASPKPVPNIDFGSIGGDRPVWIVNNLPYIAPLENGHSKQAPLGMIALTFAEIQGEIDARNFLELGKTL